MGSLHQNPDYIAGILQQVNGRPLYTGGSHEGAREAGDESSSSLHGDAEAEAKAGFSGIFGARAKATGGGAQTSQRTASSQLGHTWNWEYTQAAYLQLVRNELSRKKLLKKMDSHGDARELKVGDFIEFTASFRPSQIATLLDIATPELAEAIMRRWRQSQLLKNYSGGNAQRESRFRLEMEGDMDTMGKIAKTAMDAIRADFRSATTREYYGTVGDGDNKVTAVTICDVENFVVQDTDRILDGTFSVLGKVTSEMKNDLPILERNKILDRINPELVDEATRTLNEQMESTASKTLPNFQSSDSATRGSGDESASRLSEQPMVDLTLDSRIEGPCVKVIPIAVYI